MTAEIDQLQRRFALLTVVSAAVAIVTSNDLMFIFFLGSALITSVLYLISAIRERDRTSILVQATSAAFMILTLIGTALRPAVTH